MGRPSCQGWLNKVEKSLGGLIREHHRYYFELLDHEIFWWTDSGKSDDSIVDVISLSRCAQVITSSSSEGESMDSDLGHRFELDMVGDGERRIVLHADSEGEKLKWVAAIMAEHEVHENLKHLNYLGDLTESVKSGPLHMLNSFETKPTTDTSSPASWSTCFVHLFPDRLEVRSENSPQSKPSFCLRVTSEHYVGDSRTHDLAFVISDFDDSVRFYADDQDAKQEWMQALSRVIRARGTIQQHQERLLHSNLFQEPGSLSSAIKNNAKGATTLYSLVQETKKDAATEPWSTSRYRKQKQIEEADALFRSNKEQVRKEKFNQHLQDQETQRRHIVVARAKLARAHQNRLEVADEARVVRNRALAAAQKEVDERVEILENETRERLRAAAAEDKLDAEANDRLRSSSASSRIRNSISKMGSALSSKSDSSQSSGEAPEKKPNRFRIGFPTSSASGTGKPWKSKSSKSSAQTGKSKKVKGKKASAAPLVVEQSAGSDTRRPSQVSSAAGTRRPSQVPSTSDTRRPSQVASAAGTRRPSQVPSTSDTRRPSQVPSTSDTRRPSQVASAAGTRRPSQAAGKGPVKTPGLLGMIQAASNTSSSVLNQVEPPPVLHKYGVHPDQQATGRRPSTTPSASGSGSQTTSRPTPGRKQSSLLSRVKLWDTKVQEIQMMPISEVVQKEQTLRPGDEGYGTARPGTKTAMRAAKAQEWVEKEINKFVEVMNKIGKPGENGKIQVTFGVLFVAYQDISDTLVGIMKSAKKRKLIEYEGDMLFQGLHDHVVITLCK